MAAECVAAAATAAAAAAAAATSRRKQPIRYWPQHVYMRANKSSAAALGLARHHRARHVAQRATDASHPWVHCHAMPRREATTHARGGRPAEGVSLCAPKKKSWNSARETQTTRLSLQHASSPTHRMLSLSAPRRGRSAEAELEHEHGLSLSFREPTDVAA